MTIQDLKSKLRETGMPDQVINIVIGQPVLIQRLAYLYALADMARAMEGELTALERRLLDALRREMLDNFNELYGDHIDLSRAKILN